MGDSMPSGTMARGRAPHAAARICQTARAPATDS
jgi:hypothetical protein